MLLTLDSVSVSYGHVDVLRDLSLTVSGGEIVALLGPNGSGKSTTVHTVAGLVTAKSGTISLDGTDITSSPVRERVRKGVTLVAQGRTLFHSMTISENLRMGAFCRTDRTETDRDYRTWLETFPRLAAAEHRPAGQLSGGEQRMLAVARGMMSRPSVCLLDEPSLGVAPKALLDIGETLVRIRDDTGVGFVLVEQDLPFALDIADRVVVLSGGAIALEERPAALRDGKVLHRIFLGLPA